MNQKECENCNITFSYKPHYLWKRKYCSQKCYREKTTRPLSEKYEKYVIRNEERCWGWKGHTNDSGYAMTSFKNKNFRAHRASWIIHFGEIPKGMFVCHKCDNPICSNPNHLFLGTAKDNMNDCKTKGRNNYAPSKGEKNGLSKLTDDLVKEILSNKEGSRSLAKRLGIGQRHVNLIRQRKAWKHIKI